MAFFGFGKKNEDNTQPRVDTKSATRAAEQILNSDLQVAKPEVDLNSREVREAILQEVRRQRSNEHVLSEAQLSRLKDAMQLSRTKLDNIEDNLQKCQEHKEWIRRYIETQAELDHQKAIQFDVNKQVAVMARDEQELERYESFETIQAAYQRLQLLDTQRRQNAEQQTLLTRESDELQKQLAEQQRRLNQLTDQRKEAEMTYTQSHDVVEQVQRLEIALKQYEQRRTRLHAEMNELTNQLRVVEKEVKERERVLEQLNNKALDDRAKAHNLQGHQRMTDHGETIIGWVESLNKLALKRDKLAEDVKDSIRQQNERNERMGQVYTQYHDVEIKIAQLNDELKMHRYNNHGLDSYTLQSRAMSLRSSRLMMISAQSLWSRIVTGYTLIEEMTQRQNKVRLDLDGLNKKVDEMESVLGTLRRTCKAKEYSYTLSKSQNVILLRGDLKEGVPCTVCGAAHHPFHSDTMLDQNKLISEIKSDYESQENELKQKERYLQELLLQQAAKTTERDCLSESLHSLRQRQNGDIKEWAIYSKLDPSFTECSPSTNLEARTSMLSQMVENIGRDVDEAQKTLDDFNYNQKRINELNEEIGKLEQGKDELIVRLNELNTGCQVMAGQVERQQKQLENTTARYTKLHSELGKAITIAEWESDLSRGYETLIVHIQHMMDEVDAMNRRLVDNEHQKEVAQLMLEKSQEAMSSLQQQIQNVRQNLDDNQRNEEDARQNLHKILPDKTAKAYYEALSQAYQMARQNEEMQAKRVNALFVEYNRVNAKLMEVAEMKQQLDLSHAAERSAVDEWVREFNLNHPPVQYAELERVFNENKDWNADRKRIRELRLQAQVLQSKVDSLRTALVGLQAEGYRIPSKDEDVMEILASQTDTLEKQRADAMMQIATLKHTLDMHNKSIEDRKKAEEEGLTL